MTSSIADVSLASAPMFTDDAKGASAVLVVSVTFHGPSYAGREAADLFLRLPSSPFDAEPLAGHDFREVAGGQDLDIAWSSATRPQNVLGFRKSKRPDGTPSILRRSRSLEIGQDSRRPAGRFPFVLPHHFACANLVGVADIDRRLRARIDQEGKPRALAMRWPHLRCEASTIVGR